MKSLHAVFVAILVGGCNGRVNGTGTASDTGDEAMTQSSDGSGDSESTDEGTQETNGGSTEEGDDGGVGGPDWGWELEESKCASEQAQILVVDFDGLEPGSYAPDQDWPGLSLLSGEDQAEIVLHEDDFPSSMFLRVHLDGPAQGVRWLSEFEGDHGSLYLTYRVRFDDFGPESVGILPGLGGGEIPLACESSAGMSTRTSWSAGGAVGQILDVEDEEEPCPIQLEPLDIGEPRTFEPGVWHEVVVHVVSIIPDSSQGLVRVWIDDVMLGEQAADWAEGPWDWGIVDFSVYAEGPLPGVPEPTRVDIDDVEICTALR